MLDLKNNRAFAFLCQKYSLYLLCNQSGKPTKLKKQMEKLQTIIQILNDHDVVAMFGDNVFIIHHRNNEWPKMESLHWALVEADIHFIANWNRFIINLELN